MNKKLKVFIIIILLLLVLSGLSYGGYKLYWYIRIKTAKIEVTLKDNLTLEFTESAKVSDFITSINGKITDDYEIDSTKVGKQNIEFKLNIIMILKL